MEELDAIEVRRYGAGERTVVVLHGGPGAPGSASGLGRALAPHFQVLEPLQRRSGLVPLTVSRHVEDLSAVAPSPAVLIGWSWGAMLGLSFAARFPERVSDLVLVGCGTYDLATRTILQQSLDRRLGDEGRRKISALRGRLAAESDKRSRDIILGELGAAYMEVESYDLLETEPSSENLPPDEAGHTETWNDALRLQQEGIEPGVFRGISARVLMIHGDVDPHPGALTRDFLRQFMPGLEYIQLDRCGHEPWRERHARHRFVEVVRAWLVPR
jgi:pimeloyl-ACP methyl ester carboxylesterase